MKNKCTPALMPQMECDHIIIAHKMLNELTHQINYTAGYSAVTLSLTLYLEIRFKYTMDMPNIYFQ